MSEEELETPGEPEEGAHSSTISMPQGTAVPDKDKGKDGDKDRKEYRPGNCNDCNRQFCLEYMNLPICKGKGAEEIFTTCFRGFKLLFSFYTQGTEARLMPGCTQSEIRERMRLWYTYLLSPPQGY